MTAAQRLYTAVDRGVPDRVPSVPKIWVDLGARLTGTELTEVISDPLTALRVIARAGRDCGADAVRQFHFPARRVEAKGQRIFEVDAAGRLLGEIDMQGGLQTRLEDPREFRLEDPWWMAFHHYFTASGPFVRDLTDAQRMAVPSSQFYREQGCGDRQRRVMAELGEETAVIGDCASATMAFLVTMRGMRRALLDLIEEPLLVHRVMEKGADIAVEKGKFNIDLGLRVLRVNDSVGNMTVISPEHWREFVFPHMRDLCAELHRYEPQARLYCHICGNVLPVVEDLVATGLDCIGPLDPLGGFTPAEVRRRVGNAVSLMGGVDTLSFLEGPPERIVAEAAECIRQAGQNGGYVLGSGCVVPRDAPRENLLALREAVDRYGRYPGGQP